MLCFFKSLLHIRVIKFFSSISMQIFRTSSIISNYLRDHLISALGFEWPMHAQHVDKRECSGNLCWIAYKDASRHSSATSHIRVLTCSRGKFLLAGTNNPARCTSRIVFSNSFSIICILFCKAAIFLSISNNLSNLEHSVAHIVCLLRHHPQVALIVKSDFASKSAVM